MNNMINGTGAMVPAERRIDDGEIVEGKINQVSILVDQIESQAAPAIVAMNDMGQTTTEAIQSHFLALRRRECVSEGVLVLARQDRFSALSDLRDRDAEEWSELTRHMNCLTFDPPPEETDNYIRLILPTFVRVGSCSGF